MRTNKRVGALLREGGEVLPTRMVLVGEMRLGVSIPDRNVRFFAT